MPVIIGVDLGGTKMLAGAVDEQGKVVGELHRELTHAKEGADRVIARLADLIHQVRSALPSGQTVGGISIGVPGGVNGATGVVDKAPNLGWEGVPLAGRLQVLAGAPVFLDNDVRVAVVGEHAYGVGRGAKSMVGVWVGTGIGGGIIIDGKLLQGARGVASEIGHMIIDPRGPTCHCGNKGCIEAIASRTAMERDVRVRIEKGKKSRALKLMKKKGRTQLSSSIIEKLLEDGDPTMTKVMTKAQGWLGLFTANLINTLDPEVVVFGGGLAERLKEEMVRPIRAIAHAHLLSKRDLDRVRVVATELGEVAPVVGAALLGRNRLGPPSLVVHH
jgi:glucokinase